MEESIEEAESTRIRIFSCKLGVYDQANLYPQLRDGLLIGKFLRQN